MYSPNELKRTVDKLKINEYKGAFASILSDVIEIYIKDKEMFTLDNFSYMFMDEYELNTNCNDMIISNIYLEINQPLNYKPKKNITRNKKKNKFEIPDLYLTLDNIKQGLHDTLYHYLDSNNLLWQDKYGICIKSTVYDQEIGIMNYYFRIIPCLTYYNENNIHGVLYYKDSDIQIEYPELLIENYFNKNKITNNLYNEIILIFKNILLKDKKIDKLPDEIIETVLYNVPNEMFIDDRKETLINMINYLRNKSMKEYVSIDEQDKILVSIYRSVSLFYVKHILKLIEKYLTNQ